MQQYKVNSSVSQRLHCSRHRMERPGTNNWMQEERTALRPDLHPWAKQNCTKYNTRTRAAIQYSTNKPSIAKTIDTMPGISDHDTVILVDMTLKAQNNKKPQRRKHDDGRDHCLVHWLHYYVPRRNVETNWELLAFHLKKM